MISRVIIMAVVATSALPAAIVSLTATCSEAPFDVANTSTSATDANCTGLRTEAYATVDSFAPGYRLSTHGQFSGQNSSHQETGSARAILDADYLVTAFGGTGTVLFVPCLSATASESRANGGAEGRAMFGNASIYAVLFQNHFSCTGGVFAPAIRLTYNVPEVFHLHMEAHSYGDNLFGGQFTGGGGSATAAFSGMGYLTPGDGFPLHGDGIGVTVTELEGAVPEPSSLLLMLLGLSAASLMRFASRCRTR